MIRHAKGTRCATSRLELNDYFQLFHDSNDFRSASGSRPDVSFALDTRRPEFKVAEAHRSVDESPTRVQGVHELLLPLQLTKVYIQVICFIFRPLKRKVFNFFSKIIRHVYTMCVEILEK